MATAFYGPVKKVKGGDLFEFNRHKRLGYSLIGGGEGVYLFSKRTDAYGKPLKRKY